MAANVDLDAGRLDDLAPLSPEAKSHLDQSMGDGHLTGRGYLAVWRVALTVADLAGASQLSGPITSHWR